ncbi:MAG: DUF975 family protein [Lachnospiraceae bacterium]|nr:DUF975 family protein [Lachnospiraceae bacterium]
MMSINRKEIKKNAKGTIKSHYIMFVISLLLCAMMGVAYNSATYAFSLLKGGNEETYNEISKSISDSAYINENGDVVINNSVEDSSNDLAEEIVNLLLEDSTSAQIVGNALQGGQVQPQEDEKVGIVTLSYKNGALASAINNIKSGSFLLTISNSLSKVIKNPSVTTILTLIAGILLLLAFNTFIENALWVTTKRMFIEAQHYSSSNPKVYLFLFRKKSFFRACIAYFVKDVYQILWSITIIGGIIKFFSYAMVPYIIAENPTLTPNQAITLSRKMMNGHKWELFVLYLTFIGWEILNFITFGLLGLFFLNPYIESTLAQFYLKLREQTIDNKTEGYEALYDKYLTHIPTEEELAPVYGKLIEGCKSRSGEVKEKYTGVAGFFANVFGVVLHYNDKAKRIARQEEDAILIKRYNLILDGKLYPNRLHPTSTAGTRTPQFQTIQFLKRYSVTNLIALFFIGCFVGWLWEVSIHLVEDGVFVNRGVLHGPWLPIYGTGAVMILVLLYKFRDKAWLEFLLAIVLCGSVEYFTSWVLEVTHDGQKWWDYTGYFLNINGRVCAEGLLVFGVAGMVFVYLAAPLLDGLLQKIPFKVLLPIAIGLLVIFTADNIYSHFNPNTGKGITDYGEAQQEVPQNATSNAPQDAPPAQPNGQEVPQNATSNAPQDAPPAQPNGQEAPPSSAAPMQQQAAAAN